MNDRSIRLLLIGGAFLAGLTLFASIILIIGGRDSMPRVAPWAAPGGPFALIDQDARPVTDKDFLGKPFLAFFGFTHCPDICPTTLFEVTEVLGKLGPDAARVNVLFITVDPERDTPAVLKDYLSSFKGQVHGLTGDEASIENVVKAYGVYRKKVPRESGDYLMDHTVEVYLMDKNGKFVAPFNTALKRRPEDAAAELRRYF